MSRRRDVSLIQRMFMGLFCAVLQALHVQMDIVSRTEEDMTLLLQSLAAISSLPAFLTPKMITLAGRTNNAS